MCTLVKEWEGREKKGSDGMKNGLFPNLSSMPIGAGDIPDDSTTIQYTAQGNGDRITQTFDMTVSTRRKALAKLLYDEISELPNLLTTPYTVEFYVLSSGETQSFMHAGTLKAPRKPEIERGEDGLDLVWKFTYYSRFNNKVHSTSYSGTFAASMIQGYIETAKNEIVSDSIYFKIYQGDPRHQPGPVPAAQSTPLTQTRTLEPLGGY